MEAGLLSNEKNIRGHFQQVCIVPSGNAHFFQEGYQLVINL